MYDSLFSLFLRRKSIYNFYVRFGGLSGGGGGGGGGGVESEEVRPINSGGEGGLSLMNL